MAGEGWAHAALGKMENIEHPTFNIQHRMGKKRCQPCFPPAISKTTPTFNAQDVRYESHWSWALNVER